jgi:hypothetical protein
MVSKAVRALASRTRCFSVTFVESKVKGQASTCTAYPVLTIRQYAMSDSLSDVGPIADVEFVPAYLI